MADECPHPPPNGIDSWIDEVTAFTRHPVTCILGRFHGFDPARGFQYGTQWFPDPPPCDCGLDEAVKNARAELKSLRAKAAAYNAAMRVMATADDATFHEADWLPIAQDFLAAERAAGRIK